MKIKEYIEETGKTDSHRFNVDKRTEKILHGAIGISTEAGELLDSLKKMIYYGQELDVVNIKEELGDIMWYMTILLRELDLDLEEIFDLNIKKLRARYGEKFDEKKAFNRNLKKERSILEN